MKWLNGFYVLRCPEGDGTAAGGASSTTQTSTQNQTQGNTQAGNQNAGVDVTALLRRIEQLENEKKPTTQTTQQQTDSNDDLQRKAELKRQSDEAESLKAKKLEKAVTFTLGAPEWLKNNITLLPKTIEGIFKAADGETYGSSVDKAADLKVGIVAEFFAQQENLDQLTDQQKVALEDFKKLAKDVKRERVDKIYDDIFEPTLNMVKKVKRAEQISLGLGDKGGTSGAYENKMKELSSKHYLKKGK